MEPNQTSYAEYLEHYGVKGQRWGIRRTPEQLGHRTVSGKSRSTERRVIEGKPRGMFKLRVVQGTEPSKEEKKALKKQVREEQKVAKKAMEATIRRDEIMRDPKLLYKHRREFSPEEIKKAMDRIRMEQDLRQLSINDLSAGQVYLQTAVKYAETGISAYNKVASVYNAFEKQGKPLPMISATSSTKKKRKAIEDILEGRTKTD